MADTDQRPRFDEEAVGASHPSKSQVVGRQMTQFHDNPGRHKWKGGSSVASASSISVPDNENYFLVTGTTTITGIASTSSGGTALDTGIVVKIKFTGNLTLTFNATSFILPQGKALSITANDFCEFIHLGSGNWACLVTTALDRASSGSYRNVKVFNNSGSPTIQVDITADAITVTDTSNNDHELVAYSETVDITASGANGLDTGAENSSTRYFIYAIYGTSGNASLMSISATSPTMPTGYTFKRLVSVVLNDSGSDLDVFNQFDDRVYYDVEIVDANNITPSNTWTDVTLSIPSIARQGLIRGAARYIDTDTNASYRINGSSSTGSPFAGVTSTSDFDTSILVVPVDASQIVEVRWVAASAANEITIGTSGFIMPL